MNLHWSSVWSQCFPFRKGRLDFPGGPEVKNLPAKAGDTDWIPGPGRFYVPWSNYAREPRPLSLYSRACET